MTEEEKSFGLAERVGRLESDVSGIKVDVNHILVTLDKVADRVNTPNSVNWGWVVAGVAILLSLVGTLVAPIYAELSNLQNVHQIYEDHNIEQAAQIARLEGYLEAVKDGKFRESDQ